MSSSRNDPLRDARVLFIGVGGLGSPAAQVLARSGLGRATLVDDDCVELSNLHRQILFEEGDVGASKTQRAAERLERAGVRVDRVEGRFVPGNALELIAGHDAIIEGADNFATKFLACDAAALAGVPIVQAGAVRWVGWALGGVPGRSACLRCVFEDIPRDRAETCAEAGVIGPVVGAVGAIQAALCVRLLLGDEQAAGELWSYEGLAGAVRARRVRRRAACATCSGEFAVLDEQRYSTWRCSA
jgi:adenylyltransferase/sulfurtransferase